MDIPVVNGDFDKLSAKLRDFIKKNVELCKPKALWICDGSEEEDKKLRDLLVDEGLLMRLPKYKNCVLAHTDPKDVARVEKCTFMCTQEKRQTCPEPAPGVQGHLANWISPDDLKKAMNERFPGCMKGRVMYAIPFSMCPLESPVAKIGIELSDSAYVVISMRIMTRMGDAVLRSLGNKDFIKSLHSVGCPLPMDHEPVHHWPCNPEKTIVAHIPAKYEIYSYGSGYGGNSLLGKKCFALRLGSNLGKEEGWLAEHMLILGLTNPEGETKYITGAFPSCSGKTNLAMITPSMPGWKAECVGDDIAWMFFDDHGQLRAVNPENGFFGVCPGTSNKTNHVAMETIFENTIFTNVAHTSDGGVWWEGLPLPPDDVKITSWLGEENWTKASGKPAAHPNSRFCTPAKQCPIIDPRWEDPKGVPISAVLFGGRRPKGVPLVIESFDWDHGVFLGAACRSEATAAAEHKGKVVMHDPMAMRPFFGYNTGDYFTHWLHFADNPKLKLPKIFMVNWFRTDENGKFLWPGFGENARVLEWILQRCDDVDVARESAVGMIPKLECLDLGKEEESVDMERLFDIRRQFWLEEFKEIEKYFNDQIGGDLPQRIRDQLSKLKQRAEELPH